MFRHTLTLLALASAMFWSACGATTDLTLPRAFLNDNDFTQASLLGESHFVVKETRYNFAVPVPEGYVPTPSRGSLGTKFLSYIRGGGCLFEKQEPPWSPFTGCSWERGAIYNVDKTDRQLRVYIWVDKDGLRNDLQWLSDFILDFYPNAGADEFSKSAALEPYTDPQTGVYFWERTARTIFKYEGRKEFPVFLVDLFLP